MLGLPTKKKGRGWHGNSQAHAEAGRKGGIQSGKNRAKKKVARKR